ncbi:piggyBac transposable element-derived protein 2-like [Ixodes scapularis]|uniref:piggyBac transposable element-derived protein 2-like n=1 Tax=Ixodes scapularis TaxID=6945 RepID=UPI001A9F518F|nr:piggyBac transposable element-derived protein 2-like [Ixodes scapularis]
MASTSKRHQRHPLRDEEIKSVLFDILRGSEDDNLGDSGSDDEYTEQLPSAASETKSSSENSEDDEVTYTHTQKTNPKKVWHWVKKDIDFNFGAEQSVLKPRSGLKAIKTPLSMFLQLVDHDLLEFLTFETNRYRIQVNRTRILPLSVPKMRKFIGIVLYMSVVDLPFRRMYWSANTRQADVANCMTRNTFDEILSLIHASHNNEEVKKGDDGL